MWETAEDLMLELVGVRSDTGTALEGALGRRIYEIISRDPYFAAHPDLCGMEVGEDPLDRPVVWALRRGRGNKTLLLSGHYDAVEVDSYGPYRDLATRPEALTAALRADRTGQGWDTPQVRQDLEDGRWLFGRGVADMKGGLAAALFTLLRHPEGENSILFVAVPDEENLSAGMRRAMPLLRRVAETHGLDIRLHLIPEPQIRDPREGRGYSFYAGGEGKLLPAVVVRGRLAHSAMSLEGISGAYLLAEVMRDVEWNLDLASTDRGSVTSPPTVLLQDTFKTTYDVSLLEYAGAGINLLFLGQGRAGELLEKLRGLVCSALERAVARYEAAFRRGAEMGVVAPEAHRQYTPKVWLLQELMAWSAARGRPLEEFRRREEERLARRIGAGELTLQQASLHLIRALMEEAGAEGPAAVIGLAPPYYPAVTSFDLGDLSQVEARAREALAPWGLEAELHPYFPCMGDISYAMCLRPEEEKALLEQLAVGKGLYDVPFGDMAAMTAPTFWMGPRSRDIHQMTERVYRPDIRQVLPALLGAMADSL